ncbi:MAG TPA: heparinase II/III family protein, partial [Burkholderiales bacterium]|nr:heparinase II/III family protein [Burkholderiales bacterium]
KPLPDEPRPTAWPWGPLSDRTLYEPSAIAKMPLMRYFDGIGLVVARSDWSPDATYVTFKAGDNYWSHSHLDQGAFTIYKAGPLAIDSGLYGPTYGSDHHMNYTYQTIAHNTITVTDPVDLVPAPGAEQMRAIANDGGQRRVGSGWGVEAAPLDREEWEAKRDIYHTGSLEHLVDQDDVTLAVADITPAYTNSRSGEGTFSARTRRVERFWRTFGYDRRADVVVVFDNVIATDPAFRKRWLLHTLEEPAIRSDGFTVYVAPQGRAGRGGGRLEATVLLPKAPVINALGGRRFEFFTADKNYDEGGKLPELIQKLGPTQGEPGAWRVEVSPLQDAAADLFLVVLLPTTGDKPQHEVRLLESEKRVGCEISGAERTTRWWFDRSRNVAEVEIVAGGRVSRHRAEGRSTEAPPARSWIARLKGEQ